MYFKTTLQVLGELANGGFLERLDNPVTSWNLWLRVRSVAQPPEAVDPASMELLRQAGFISSSAIHPTHYTITKTGLEWGGEVLAATRKVYT